MKLSEATVQILKNFATINPNLVVKPGNKLRTLTVLKNIYAEATVAETFPSEFGIYDLTKTLSIMSMTKEGVDVEFSDDSLIFVGLGGKGRIKQRLCDPKMFKVVPPEKSPVAKSYEIQFLLPDINLKWIRDAAYILGVPNVLIKSDDSKHIVLAATDEKGEIQDSASLKLEALSAINFQAVFKIDNLKMIAGEYQVDISSAGVAKFSNREKPLNYFIAVEQAESSFGA